MSNLQEPETWQEFLGQLVSSPRERSRLAAALRIRPITLQRWVENESRPRDANIRALLKNLPPGTYPLFMRLLLRDFPELLRDELPQERLSQQIPSEFYARAMSNLALTPHPMYSQSMQDLIFQQALEHLDPDRRGLMITLVVCVPPRAGQKVRSLREVGGLATPPWPQSPAEKPMFLGSESLIGYALMHMRPYVINSKEEMTLFPAHWTVHERSAAAFPILRQSRLVGGLIISSVQEYFFTPPRNSVIEGYADLASCIFEQSESYDPKDVDLWLMPPYAEQLPYFASYNQRVSQKFFESYTAGQQATLQQIRQRVWQELEDDLLKIISRQSGMVEQF
jgi:GAF domain-containing protein